MFATKRRLLSISSLSKINGDAGVFRPTVAYQSTLEGSTPHEDVSSSEAAFNIPFAFARHGDFLQAEPKHENAWVADRLLQTYFKRILPADVLSEIEGDLHRFGGRVSDEIWQLGRECEENPPILRQTNAWGRRVDEIITCSAWKQQKCISAEEGLIAIPYERKQGEFSRLYQVAKLYMYSPSSGLYSCPLAMTDGAAKTIEALQLNLPEAWSHLTSRDPEQFWTSGQWMTERKGGSDVAGGTETIAVPDTSSGVYRLYGYKWFSSATDSNMTLTLARIANAQGETLAGSKGLSMFYLPTRKSDGTLNNIQVVKMKNKLGTRQLPTAELLLDGSVAQLVSHPGRGVATISSMLTVTRLHNVISSVAAMRKILCLARDYATRREAFRKRIDQHPLHVKTLSRMEVDTQGCEILMLDLARQMGQHDTGNISDQDLLLLRLMTPVAKYFTGKMAMSVTSEGLECFGGQGYIEDTGLPGMLRDAQVLPIWEGTSNVMSLDVVRAIGKTKGEALKAYRSRIRDICEQASAGEELREAGLKLENSVNQLLGMIQGHPEILEYAARDFTHSLATTYIAALLIEHALSTQDVMACRVAKRWSASDLLSAMRTRDEYSECVAFEDREIAYSNYTNP